MGDGGWGMGDGFLLPRQVVSGNLTAPEARLILAKSGPSQIQFMAE